MTPYLVQRLTFLPSHGLSIEHAVPLDDLKAVTIGGTGRMTVVRSVVTGGKEVWQSEAPLEIKNGEWIVTDGAAHTYRCEGPKWDESDDLGYAEIYVRGEGDTRFVASVMPAFYYTVFGRGKPYMTDPQPKFADRNQVFQMRAYGAWCVGYPASEVDPARDVDESVLVVNPYSRAAVVSIELRDATGRVVASQKVRVSALSGKRVALSTMVQTWAGQVIISGPNRLTVWLSKHSLRNPADVTTVEHIDYYRGESSWRPFTQALHRSLLRYARKAGRR